MSLRSLLHTAGLFNMLTMSPFLLAGNSITDPLTALNTELWWKSDGWCNGFPFDSRWEGEAISHSADGMAITLSHAPNGEDAFEFQSGELRSHDFYGYGCYEVEIKPIAEPGVISSFFLFAGPYDKPEDGNGKHNEIDIEFLGHNTSVMQVNYWTNHDSHARSHEHLIYLDFDASQDFHRYGIKWTKDAINWYVDGKLVHSVQSTGDDPTPSVTDSRLRIMANVWATSHQISNWAGEFSQDPATTVTAEYKNFRFVSDPTCAQGNE
ncbi:1,3-beta-glucanase [Photobacterium gaetbulicola]|uniref:Beta-glucanase n=1 Tax=Photobacterium gaetbulicola Gung47 TaxID=658445 RepID=A0A0C5W9T3_9GAMM|nr:family 16 glycosylhydrolase [Photobacterium gaetbulicola]AJR08296.1 putative exported glycosyl hydrolase, family 16 [Photobacterium gaetbulicola Gung47]PSU09027.1 1,3-beta-glucanase [Photobacterium gaetbulicola]